MKTIRYRDGYKYQLAEHFEIDTPIRPEVAASTDFIVLTSSGRMVIAAGYAWDGPSGPTIDTPSSLRASLVHDALYQLMRRGLLPRTYRAEADELLYQLCVEDGMWKWRAWLWRREVKKFAGYAADPKNVRPVRTAPA